MKIFINSDFGELDHPNIYSTDIPISYMINDGNIDIISINRVGAGINIFYNNGDRTLFHKIFIPTDNSLNNIDVSYINGDDKLDIIITYFRIKEMRIMFNEGNEQFTNQTTYETDDVPSHLRIIDINNDEEVDLIIVYYFYGLIGIHFNLGNGTFNSDNSSYPLMLMPSDAKPIDLFHIQQDRFWTLS